MAGAANPVARSRDSKSTTFSRVAVWAMTRSRIWWLFVSCVTRKLTDNGKTWMALRSRLQATRGSSAELGCGGWPNRPYTRLWMICEKIQIVWTVALTKKHHPVKLSPHLPRDWPFGAGSLRRTPRSETSRPLLQSGSTRSFQQRYRVEKRRCSCAHQ